MPQDYYPDAILRPNQGGQAPAKGGTQWVKVQEGNLTGDDPSGGEVSLQDAPLTGPVDTTQPTDELINNADSKKIETSLTGKTDKKTINNVKEVFGPATGIASAISLLDKGIEKQESKRDAMKLMAFGLSMLAGNGINKSLVAANSVGGFNKQRIDELYSQRKTIQDRVTKAALDQTLGTSDTGKDLGAGYRGDDKKVYFKKGNTFVDSQGNQIPEGVSITHKLGTEDEGDLPAKAASLANKADESLDQSYQQKANIVNVLKTIPEDADFWSGGIFGGARATWKDLFGSQEQADVWRTQVRGLLTTEAISKLPPGVASDKDIELVTKATLNPFANPEALKQFLAASQRLINYSIRYNEAKRDYIYDNRGTKGFKAPKYDPDGVDQATEGVVVGNKNNPDGIDLDLSK